MAYVRTRLSVGEKCHNEAPERSKLVRFLHESNASNTFILRNDPQESFTQLIFKVYFNNNISMTKINFDSCNIMQRLVDGFLAV